MATGVLFIGWGPAIPGREQQALKVFGDAVAYWSDLQQRGEITSFEPVALEPHGGELAGFAILRGDQERLSRLRIDPAFVDLNTRGQLVVTHFGVVMGYVGEGLNQLFAGFGKHAAALA
ncbi:MAG TPA: hypothetical protein VIJ28_19375 [Chloroflexota bacterium]|jgi:hypothetical protein